MSTQKKPTFRIKSLEPIGVELFFLFPDLQEYEKSFLEADIASGSSSLTANGTNFSANDYIVIGQPGYEKTEIIKISNASSTAITTATSTIFAHNRGDSIRYIPYNQIVVSRSTDSGTTYTPLSAVDIRPDALETYMQRSSDASTDYYKFRFYNSTSTLYSGYSDEITGAGYDDNTLFACKKRALNSLGEKIDNLITDEYLNESVREARRIVDMDPRIFRWSFRTKFNTDIGNVIPGTYKVACPTDLRDKNTNKNILSIRIGTNEPLEYQDRNDFNENYEDVAHTTLNGTVTTGDPTITLTSSGDFEESGDIYVAAADVAGTIDTVSYTANDESTNIISGVTGIQAAGHATNTDVWQEMTFGLPTNYTVDRGYIFFDVPFDDDYAGENIWMDYYCELPELLTDSQTFDEPFYDLYTSYLKWKIKYKKSNGKIERNSDSDYLEFTEGVSRLVTQEINGQSIQFIPS